MDDNIEIRNPEIDLYRQIALSEKRPKVRKMFSLLGFTPHKGQEMILDIYDNHWKDYYFYTIMSGRRLGKSLLTSIIATTELMTPFANVLIIAPVSKQAGIIYKEIVKFVKQLGIGFKTINNNEMTFVLENGSEIMVGNYTRLEASEGRAVSLLILEETGLIPDIQKVLNSLMPSTASYGVIPDTKLPVSRVILNGTYKNSPTHKEYYLKGVNNEKGFKSFSLPSSLNPMVTKEFLEGQKEILGDLVFRREYLAELVDVSGTDVFYEFDPKTHIVSYNDIVSTIDKDSIIIGGLDIGATDSSSYVLVKVEGGKYYIFDGFEEPNLEEEKIAYKIKELENKYGITPQVRFIDPSAKITSIGLANTYDIATYPAKNAIKEGIGAMNRLFRINKLFVCDNMKQLLVEIQTIQWKESLSKNSSDPFQRPEGNLHHFDQLMATRYAIFTYFKSYSDNDLVVI